MRQTDLPLQRVAALAAQHVGHPDQRLKRAEHLLTTALPRLGRMTCSTANVPMNTHSHQVLPLTRAEVSSTPTGLAVTVAWIAAAAASNGARARASMLLIAPSLMLNEKLSSISKTSRSRPIAWA